MLSGNTSPASDTLLSGEEYQGAGSIQPATDLP